MPLRAVDLFSGPSGGTCAPEATLDDLAASLNGRYLYIYTDTESVETEQLLMLDTLRSTLVKIDTSEALRNCREHLFTFVLDETTLVLVLQVNFSLDLGVFKVKLEKEKLHSVKLVAQVTSLFAALRIIACQWGTDVFVILTDHMDNVYFHRYDTVKMSLLRTKKSIANSQLKDAVAFDGRLFAFRAKEEHWMEPETILVTDFENGYESRWRDLKGDDINGFPMGSDFAMDIANCAIWIYADHPSEKSHSLWNLSLLNLSWSKVELNIPHPLHQPLLHCLPNGKAYLLGECPNFWLESPRGCVTPAHLFTFWLEVPKLRLLAQEAVLASCKITKLPFW